MEKQIKSLLLWPTQKVKSQYGILQSLSYFLTAISMKREK